MRFSIHTLGTRGDVQPYLALARGLVRRGHEVLIVAPAQFGDMVESEHIGFAAMPRAFLDLLDTAEAKAVIGKSGTGFGAGFKLLKHARGMMREMLDVEWRAALDFSPDAILYHPKALGAPHIASKLAVPLFFAAPLPGFTPTSAFPTPLLPFANLGPFNRVSHNLMMHSGAFLFSGTIREWRKDSLGLPARGKPAALAGTLYGYSAKVLPKPVDWGSDVAVTGYWFLEDGDWIPDEPLSAFLAAGEAPIYVGFGSMPDASLEGLTQRLVDGLRLAGKRGVIATGGGALQRLEDAEDMHFIAGAPHDLLFPMMHATLHHGGAGTTGAALRAGKPTAICPFFGDQPFWARRTKQLGIGPGPLDKRRLSANDVATAIRAMDDTDMRERAATLGAAIRSEDGVGTAIEYLEMQMTRIT